MTQSKTSNVLRSHDQEDAARTSSAELLNQRVRSLRLPAEATDNSSGHSRLAWTLCLALAATSGWLGYLLLARGSAAAPDTEQQTPKTSLAPVAITQPGTGGQQGEIVLESNGYIIPTHQILVSPQVSGRLVKVYIEEGQRVKQGQVLAEIEQTDYRADYERAVATLELAKQRWQELEQGNRPEEIAQAEAELQEAEALLPQAEAALKRNKTLRESNAVPELEYEQSESQCLSLKRRIERLTFALKLMKAGARQERKAAAMAEVKQTQAELAKAQWRLDNCTLRAPISGTILRKNAEEGNIVNPVAFNGSYSLGEMADLSDLEVELNIDERDISRVFPKQACRVRAEAYPDRVYQGVVSRLMPIADRAKGAVPVRVALRVPSDEEGIYLKPEMRATVSFLRNE